MTEREFYISILNRDFSNEEIFEFAKRKLKRFENSKKDLILKNLSFDYVNCSYLSEKLGLSIQKISQILLQLEKEDLVESLIIREQNKLKHKVYRLKSNSESEIENLKS